MTFLELAKQRYSVRSFSQKPIEDEKLKAVLEAGKVAPTAVNYQPQKIYVLKSENALRKINSVCDNIFGAPVVFVIGYDKNRDWKNRRMPGYHSGETDAAIVCTHMMLEAWEQGLGSCWVGWFNAEEVRCVLGLPENVQVTSLLPVGYAAEDAKPSANHTIYREDDDMIAIL